jgi:hypothetical protein
MRLCVIQKLIPEVMARTSTIAPISLVDNFKFLNMVASF